MTQAALKPYTAADREACLSIFDGNVPKYFGAEERGEFEEFLDDLPGPYFTLVLNDNIIGCGGYGNRDGNKEGVGFFCWGMIARSHHKQGYGTILAEMRVNAMRDDPSVKRVRLNTSQHTAPFYARFGFETVKTIKDGFSEGLDDIEMHLVF